MEQVTYSSEQLPGFITGPADGPAVIVLQEYFGVTDTVKQQALLLSQATGFRTLIPDLYHGKVGVNAEEARHLSSHLDWSKAKDELVTAVNWLKSSGSPKVGITGFCQGGALSMIAAQFADVACAAPCYGTPRPPFTEVENIKVPIQGHFGELDNHKPFSDPDTAKSVFDRIKAAGNGSVELFIYPGCGHGFLNAIIGEEGEKSLASHGNPIPPKEQVQLAFDRIATFMKQHLSA